MIPPRSGLRPPPPRGGDASGPAKPDPPRPLETDPLARYWAKRNFAVTNEPRGDVDASGAQLSFVIQKHHASRLHYDFRLELDGVLLSWAVPKGPSYDVGSSRVDLQACKLEYSIVSPK